MLNKICRYRMSYLSLTDSITYDDIAQVLRLTEDLTPTAERSRCGLSEGEPRNLKPTTLHLTYCICLCFPLNSLTCMHPSLCSATDCLCSGPPCGLATSASLFLSICIIGSPSPIFVTIAHVFDDPYMGRRDHYWRGFPTLLDLASRTDSRISRSKACVSQVLYQQPLRMQHRNTNLVTTLTTPGCTFRRSENIARCHLVRARAAHSLDRSDSVRDISAL